MQIFFSEHNKDYSSYTFDYAVYAIMDEASELDKILNKGFLPYSNSLELKEEIFYLARSLRVNTKDFKNSSENRRVNRKIVPLNLQEKIITRADFNFNDPAFNEFCLSYANQRFSGNALNEERFKYICNRQNLNHIFSYQDEQGKQLAYVFVYMSDHALQYWYAFFDTSYLASYPIGKWLMWRSIDLAKEKGIKHVYLGTCYGEKSLYKVRDFSSLAYFDGRNWNSNIDALKTWCKTDHLPLSADRFKL